MGNLLEVQHEALSSPVASWTRGYHYDPVNEGNRLLATSLPGDDLQVPTTFSAPYTYDVHGNMLTMPHATGAIAWDHADRMQHFPRGGGGEVWFVYDADGNRVRKVWVSPSGSIVRERIYLGDEIWREHSCSPMEVQKERETLYVSDDTGRIVMVETLTFAGDAVVSPANVARYQYGNHLGTVAVELDDAANVISYEGYHPYGSSAYRAVSSAIEVSAKRYRYAGKERDEGDRARPHGGAVLRGVAGAVDERGSDPTRAGPPIRESPRTSRFGHRAVLGL